MVGVGHDVKIISWEKHSNVAYVVKTLVSVDQQDPTNGMSAGLPGPDGRIYFGTYSSKFCGGASNTSFYMYSERNGAQELFGGVKDTCGLAIDKKRNILYHLQTCNQVISQFTWDPHTGDICMYMRIKFVLFYCAEIS